VPLQVRQELDKVTARFSLLLIPDDSGYFVGRLHLYRTFRGRISLNNRFKYLQELVQIIWLSRLPFLQIGDPLRQRKLNLALFEFLHALDLTFCLLQLFKIFLGDCNPGQS
jgi:hypothetical protein